MPREEDDDLFHSEADVDFDDDDAPAKKSAKKKTAKKAAKKKVAKKVADTKKAPKKRKKVKRVTAEDDTPVKPKKKKAKKSKPESDSDGAPAEKPAKGGFAAGLFDDQDAPAEKPADEKPADKSERRSRREEREPEAAADQRDHAPADDPSANEDQYGRPAAQANYVVHVYELGRLKRTIDRDFTPEDAEAFATVYSKTSKRYGRKAVAGKKDTQPAKELTEY